MGTSADPVVLVAHALAGRREDFIRLLIETIENEIAVLNHEEPLRGLLEASVTENVVTGLHFLGNGIDPRTVDAPASATSYARRLAQRDVPLSALLRAYRVGQARFLNQAVEEARGLGRDEHATTVMALVNATAAFGDRVCEQVARAYEEERERWVSSRGALRQHWVTQLLRDPSPDVGQAEAALGYRLGGTHLAVEAWLDRSVVTGDALDVFDSTRALLHSVFQAHGHPLAVPTDEADVRIWFPVKAHHAVDAGHVSAEVERARLPVRVAIGTPRPGLDGFRRSVRGAARAKALALSAGERAPRAISFAEVAPVALLVDEPGELADFVSDTLGGLAVDERWREALRETLRVFLATNRSYTATAQQLLLHRNTVRYRVQQATGKYGLVLEDNAFELQLALSICRWYGPRVLSKFAADG